MKRLRLASCLVILCGIVLGASHMFGLQAFSQTASDEESFSDLPSKSIEPWRDRSGLAHSLESSSGESDSILFAAGAPRPLFLPPYALVPQSALGSANSKNLGILFPTAFLPASVVEGRRMEMDSGRIFLWIGFNLFVLALLAIDLGVFHRKAHSVSSRKRQLGALSGFRSR